MLEAARLEEAVGSELDQEEGARGGDLALALFKLNGNLDAARAPPRHVDRSMVKRIKIVIRCMSSCSVTNSAACCPSGKLVTAAWRRVGQ
jgi:hypothetical protein